jgi:hypothetical protein
MKEICSNCKNWKPKQAELDYNKFYGICTSHIWKFVSADSPDIRVLDRKNPSGKFMNVHTFENKSKEVPIGEVRKSQYCFVTNENFGCVNYEHQK